MLDCELLALRRCVCVAVCVRIRYELRLGRVIVDAISAAEVWCAYMTCWKLGRGTAEVQRTESLDHVSDPLHRVSCMSARSNSMNGAPICLLTTRSRLF